MERDWIDFLCNSKTLQCPDELLIGIGDDTAMLAPFPRQANTFLTTDMLTEGVDFLLCKHSPEQIGRKALAVNLSDLAAMAAEPFGVLVSVALPRSRSPFDLAKRLYAGMKPLLEHYNVTLLGGDTNTWDGGLVISITAIGRLDGNRQPFRRSGGKIDDHILVTGSLGGSLLQHQFTFEPKISEAIVLSSFNINAAIDISDGLLLDLSRLANASELGAEINLEAIPISDDAHKMSKTSGKTPLEHALSDGEDFELLLATDEKTAAKLMEKQPLIEKFNTPITDIGKLTEQKGLRATDQNGTREIEPRGYEH
ncbi:MAG: thiamine-phosphate kinase [Planctomycetaceae bacterium]|jgi:thiamine-monophosphate kinase|nr:thiamine-phosphate kinase [Planctomycetaceae bacterium]